MKFFKNKYLVFAIPLIVFLFCRMNAQAASPEAVYLQTDRITYIAGEPLFYKMYVLDATTKRCSGISRIGYIEFRSPNSDPALKIRVKVEAGLADGSITLPDTLSSGVYQVVAFTGFMKNFGEQLFFYKEIQIVNRFDKKYNLKLLESSDKDDSNCQHLDSVQWIQTDKQIYAPREKVVVNLGKINSKANVSVSVFEDAQTGLRDHSMAETLKELSVLPADGLSLDYLPELRGKILRGRAIDQTSGKGVQGATVLLSCPDTVANLQYALTNADGMFQLLLDDYYNGKELFLTIQDMPAGQDWKIEVEDNFALSEKWEPELFSNKVNLNDYVTKSQNIVYINKSYDSEKVVSEPPVLDNRSVCPQLYHCPVSAVYPSDFVPLDSFPEISVEILPTVRMHKRNGKYHIRMLTPLRYYYGEREPVVFLDGVYVDDLDKIVALGSEKIKRIEVLENERAFGDLFFYGIISIVSKTNEIVGTVPASNSLRLRNDPINTGKSFVVLNPNSIKDVNTPFFKQLLYWNPNIEINGTDSTAFEFYSSDNTARFIIKVDGISEDGAPISASTCIQVKNPINFSAQ